MAFLASDKAGVPQAATGQTNIIHIEIGGLRSNKSQVFCALYSSPDGFPKNREKAVTQLTQIKKKDIHDK
jgi:uncharacterized protein (DUF2141 family)